MSDPPTAPEPANVSFEDLLVRLLDAVERDGPAALERLCSAHPEHAARLRSHARRLSEFGMLATAPPNAAGGLPERLGDYRPLRRIGAGGMGNVWVAEQVSLGRRVALKLIRPEQLWFAGARERFAREVHAIARLQHPGIVPVHDAGETAGLPWLAMELVEGASLDEVLAALGDRAPGSLTGADLEAAVQRVVAGRRDPTAAPATASGTRPPVFTGSWVAACLRIARAVADALVHAHERGVLHRDVKPSNVMLTPDGRALLLDFGLARADGTTRLTQDQSQLGSPAYMSPEQVRGHADIDARTDVWSLGVTLCELLTLRPPFGDESPERTRAAVLEARPPQLRRANPAVPRDAELVCLTALSGERDRRYATMRAFAADLDNLLETRPVQARPPTPGLVLRRWIQRRPATAIGVLAAFLVLVIAPTVFWLQQRSANERIRDALATTEKHRAREQKAREQAQQDRDAAREVVQQWMTRVASEELVDAPGMQELRRDLLAGARTYHERFLADAGDDTELLEQAAESAIQLATIHLELGENRKGAEAASRAVELADRLVHTRGRDRVSLALAAQARARIAAHETSIGGGDAAYATLRDAIDLQRESLAIDPGDDDARGELMSMLRTAALAADRLGRDDEANAWSQEIQEVFVGDDGEARASAMVRQMAIGALADEAHFHLRRGRTVEAARAAERLIEWRHSVDEATMTSIERIAVARAFEFASRIRRGRGDLAEAERLARECVAEAERVLADLPQHANALRLVAGGLNSLALVIGRDPARRTQAIESFERSIAEMRRLVARDAVVVEPQINLATSLVNLAAMRIDDGEFDAARTLLTEAEGLARHGRAALPSHEEAAATLHNAVWFLGQLAGHEGDHRAQVEAARRLAALRPDEARTQRIAGALIAEACTAIGADGSLAAQERSSLLAERGREALALLARAADLGCTDHAYLAEHEHLAAIRGLPGFAEIVARMTANAQRGQAR